MILLPSEEQIHSFLREKASVFFPQESPESVDLKIDEIIKPFKRWIAAIRKKKLNVYDEIKGISLLFEIMFPQYSKKIRRFMKTFIAKKSKEQYKQKYGEDISNLVNRAKNGQRKSIFQLIEWNVEFLFQGWMKVFIKNAVFSDDQRFLERLGDAIRKTRRPFGKTRAKADKDEPKFIMKLLFGHLSVIKSASPNNENEMWKALHNVLYEMNLFESPDPDYFFKYLKRHNFK